MPFTTGVRVFALGRPIFLAGTLPLGLRESVPTLSEHPLKETAENDSSARAAAVAGARWGWVVGLALLFGGRGGGLVE